jgi:hypothetical protein
VVEAATSGVRQVFARRSTAQFAAALGLVIAALLMFGCGGGGDSTTAANGAPLPQNVVTDDDISAQPDGSPQQALLEWWQAYQFADAQQVIDRTSKETLKEVGEKSLSDMVAAQGQGLQAVEVLGGETDGDNASVRVGLLQFEPSKPGGPQPTSPTSSTPDTFEMKQEGSEWKFASTDYLVPKVEAFEQAQKQQEQTTTTTTTSTTSTGKG